MTGFIRFNRLLVVGLVAAAAWPAAAAGHSNPRPPARVPSDIAVPAGNKDVLDGGHAVRRPDPTPCNATATGHAWALVAPAGESVRPPPQAHRHALRRADVADQGRLARSSGRARPASTSIPTAIDWLLVLRHVDDGGPCRRHDVHPADQHHRRPRSACRGLQRGHGRDDEGNPCTPPTTSSGRRRLRLRREGQDLVKLPAGPASSGRPQRRAAGRSGYTPEGTYLSGRESPRSDGPDAAATTSGRPTRDPASFRARWRVGEIKAADAGFALAELNDVASPAAEAERRRNRTYQRPGYGRPPVLKSLVREARFVRVYRCSTRARLP